MGSLKDEAKAYEPKQTLNIADLDRVDLSFPIEDRTGKDKDDKEFNYKVLVVNSQEFRVPNTVLEKIKEMLDLKPDLKFVKVEKAGSGLNTRYSVKKIE
jgi:hypothetical protein